MARYPKIRSRDHPRGLPARQLSTKDKEVLRRANRVTDCALKLMTEFSLEGHLVSIEQPAGSLLFKDPGFLKWASRSGAVPTVVDYCMYGMPYRKRTALWGPPSLGLSQLARRCPGVSSKHKRPKTLSGWGQKKKCLATWKGCAAYPPQLCQALAGLFA